MPAGVPPAGRPAAGRPPTPAPGGGRPALFDGLSEILDLPERHGMPSALEASKLGALPPPPTNAPRG